MDEPMNDYDVFENDLLFEDESQPTPLSAAGE
jgi:hypothetical protein